MRQRTGLLLVMVLLSACGPTPVARAPLVRMTSTPQPVTLATPEGIPLPSPARGAQDAIPGPAGMTLSQEIGAVMMVGFSGSLTPAVLAHWRLRQYGGLIVQPGSRNVTSPNGYRQMIQEIRAAAGHTLLAATTQAGGSGGSPAIESQMRTMSAGLRALGFDVNFVPAAVADASGVAAALAGIHAAGMYGVALDDPADQSPVRAAIGAQVEFVMVGHRHESEGPTIQALRQQLGFHGVTISDDLLTATNALADPAPVAAVRFLQAGGDMVIVSDLAMADTVDNAIHAAVLDGTYLRGQLDASVQKLLNLSLKFMP